MLSDFENKVFDICLKRMSNGERLCFFYGLNALLRELEKFNVCVDTALEIKQKFSSL